VAKPSIRLDRNLVCELLLPSGTPCTKFRVNSSSGYKTCPANGRLWMPLDCVGSPRQASQWENPVTSPCILYSILYSRPSLLQCYVWAFSGRHITPWEPGKHILDNIGLATYKTGLAWLPTKQMKAEAHTYYLVRIHQVGLNMLSLVLLVSCPSSQEQQYTWPRRGGLHHSYK
jgi:hypothetical protein